MPEHGTYLGNPLLKSAHVPQDWTEEQVGETLERLTVDRDYRKMLFDRMEPFQFTKNKERVISLIHSMLKH